MPAKKPSIRRTFLLDQPLFRLREGTPEQRWGAVISEGEPLDEQRRGASFADAHRQLDSTDVDAHAWERLDRTAFVTAMTKPTDAWNRVAIVCTAGLGKTTNVQYFEAAINEHGAARAGQLAFGLEIADLPATPADLLPRLVNKVRSITEENPATIQRALERKRAQGKITLLLDSLDQAGADPKGAAICNLTELLQSPWAMCPIWVTGRPHAFAPNRALFMDHHAWQFLRVGQLDEPEARFLLEATRREMRQRREA